MNAINLANKFSLFDEHWSPKIIGELNDSHVKLAKLQGEFIWHHHDDEDELFLVVKGRLLMKFRDKDEWVNEGEFIIVPKSVEHKPVAEEEVHLVLIEPKTTTNTGSEKDSERSKEAEWL
ncbi:MAG: cupin domain-containing protein [Chloroflexi bacterium]|nr:MAG: cupin domain-containing protein [Chloroflexota bacterium]MBL1193637.1 cupin domain-containing protein [Chloroflexota bacterium]NOH10929.1 cupin domain-containing protein [Chloroflexota bacterium]